MSRSKTAAKLLIKSGSVPEDTFTNRYYFYSMRLLNAEFVHSSAVPGGAGQMLSRRKVGPIRCIRETLWLQAQTVLLKVTLAAFAGPARQGFTRL